MAQKWWVLAAIACGTYMATLDSSIVNIALPTLTKEFGADLPQVKWVVVIYLLVITCFLLPFGRLADIHGRKRVFFLGMFVFTAGSMLCGFSASLGLLVASRAIQAIGASMLMANGPAIIAASFPSSERGSALGIMAMVVSAGLVSGPSLGSLLITHLSWRSIFWVNAPIGIAGMLLVWRNLRGDLFKKRKLPFDWPGTVLQSVVLMLFIVLFDPPNISVSGSMPFQVSRLALVAAIAIAAGIFVKIELNSPAPLLDMSLLKNRTFWTANLAALLTFVAYSAVTVLMPFFLEEELKYTVKEAGLLMTAIPLTIFVVAPVSGRLSDRFGSQELSFAGALIGTLGLFAMAGVFGDGLNPMLTPFSTALFLVINGLAIGLFQSPNNSAIMGSVPTEKLGVASALLATVRNLGLVTGTGIATSVFSYKMEATAGDFTKSLHFTIAVAGIAGLGAMAAALGKKRGRNGILAVDSLSRTHGRGTGANPERRETVDAGPAGKGE